MRSRTHRPCSLGTRIPGAPVRIPRTRITADELLTYHDPFDRRVELVRGHLVVSEPSGFEHGRVAAAVAFSLSQHLARHADATGVRLGEVATNDPGCWIERDPDTVRAPGVAFVAAHRSPPQPLTRYLETAPTIAVEVLSPGDRPRAVRAKVAQWLRAGARLMWVVDPERRTVHVHRADGSHTALGADGAIEGEDVLPGFTLRRATLFR